MKLASKRLIGLIFAVFLALPVGLYAQKTEQDKIDEMLKLINKPYSEFFRNLGETYKVDEEIWKKVQKLMRDEDTKETNALNARVEELKQKRNSLRKERKKYNDELSKIQVKIERLQEKLDSAKEKGEDTSSFEKEIKTLRTNAEEPTNKSNDLKRELDGDTSFNMAEAVERLELLQDSLESASSAEQTRLKVEIAQLETKIEAATGLNRLIRKTEKEKFTVEARNYHKFSKLDSLKTWPNKLRAIRDTVDAGRQGERKYGNVEEIGDLEKREMRKVHVAKILPSMVSEKSEVQMGRQAAEEILRYVKIHKNEEITEYVNRLGQNLVRNSDAWCPFAFYTIADPPDNRQLNAVALPGGQVFVNDTLILNMRSEAELAAALAHEISHVNSRHYAKAASKMQYLQIAEMAGYILGAIGYLGTQGADLAIGVAGLGITRASESEADLLGTQYLWKAGYDPRALEESFDRILKYEKAGGFSFWQTHPSTPDRIESVEEEVRYLPPKEEYLIGGQEFFEVQQAIRKARLDINKERKEEDKNKPTLRRPGEPDPNDKRRGEEPETPPVLKRKSSQSETPQPETKPSEEDKPPVLKRPDATETRKNQENRNEVICVQVITKAKNPQTGEVRDFPTPCDVPNGWEVVK